jgi:predicted dehydrogenase
VEDYYGRERGTYKGCRAYSDFRELLARDDIDAVTVCTPDHWHGLISGIAARAGKDVYCEKAFANTVAEGRVVCNAVKRYGRVLQVGTQERSTSSARFACELVRNGRIGTLHTIRVNMPIDDPPRAPVPDSAMPVPAGLDYDMWLGPMPWAPYTQQRVREWRQILDYGGGEITDRGAHIIDLAQFVNGTDYSGPIEIKARGTAAPEGLFNAFTDYEFECAYADGVRMIGGTRRPRGLKFEGTEGWIFIHIHGGRLEAEPASLLQESIGPDEIHLGRSPGHHRDFLDAVKERRQPIAPGEVGHRSATICHLINIVMLLRCDLEWDPNEERIINNPSAQRMLSKPFREPWHL